MNQSSVSATPDLTLADLVRFFKRRWLEILLGGVALAGVMGLYLVLLVPQRFESAALLSLSPARGFEGIPTVKGMDPPDLLALLRSDAVIQDVESRLEEQGILGSGESLTFGEDLLHRLEPRGRGDPAALVHVIGRAPDAETAAALARTWSAAFQDRVDGYLEGELSEMAQELGDRRQQALEEQMRLKRLQTSMLEEENAHSDRLQSEWRSSMARLQRETDQKIASVQVAARDEMLAALEAAGAQSGTNPSGSAAGEPADGIASTGDSYAARGLARTLAEVVNLRAALVGTPAILRDDDGERLLLGLTGGAEEDSGQSLHVEQSNPAYEQLFEHVVEAEARAYRLAEDRIEPVAELLAELARIQRRHAAGVAALGADRRREVDRITRNRDQRWQEWLSEQRPAREQIAEELQEATQIHSRLSKDYVPLSMAAEADDFHLVRVVTPAAATGRTVGQRKVFKIAAAGALGLLLGLGIAVVREVG